MTIKILEKQNFLKPLALVSGLVCLVFLASLLFLYSISLGFSQIGTRVIYDDSSQSLVVTHVYEGHVAAKTLDLKVGDKIIAFDELPTPVFAATRHIILVSTNHHELSSLPNRVYNYPFTRSVEMTLVGVQATKLTLLRAQTNSVEVTNLKNFLPNATYDALLTVQFLVGLIFWSTSFALYIFRPNSWLTFWFIGFFGASGVYLVGNISGSIVLDLSIFTVLMSVSFLSSTGFIYFSLLFPFGKSPGKRTKILFGLFVLIYLSVNIIYFYVNVSGQGDSIQAQELSRWRLRLLTLAILTALIILLVKLVKSRGLERARLKFAGLAFLLSGTPPFVVFVCYTSFGWFAEFTINYFGMLSVFGIFFPLASLYAILRHKLFYPDFVIRRVLVYVFLASILMAVYVVTQAAISFVLYHIFGISNNAFGFLAFLAVALAAAEARNLAQRVIDQVFYRDKLDYTTLVKNWVLKIIQNSASLSQLCYVLSKEAATDFRYEQVAVLLGNLRSNPEFWTGAQKSTNSENVLLVYWLSDDEMPETLQGQTYQLETLVKHEELIECGLNVQILEKPEVEYLLQSDAPIYQVEKAVLHFAFFIPFDKSCAISGGLLFSHKLSEQLPIKEEINALVSLTQQTALAISVALELEKEQYKIRVIRSVLAQQNTLADETQQKVARELHDTAVQEVISIRNRLDAWLIGRQTQSQNIIQEKTNSDNRFIKEAVSAAELLEQSLRNFIQRMKPRPVEFGLVTMLEELISQFAATHPHFNFSYYCPLTVSQEEILQRFTPEQLREIDRIANDAILNSLRHSKGSQLLVELFIDKTQTLVLRVHDDGVGFGEEIEDTFGLIANNHFGVAHIQERVRLLQGNLVLGRSNRYGGACVEVKISLKEKISKHVTNDDFVKV